MSLVIQKLFGLKKWRARNRVAVKCLFECTRSAEGQKFWEIRITGERSDNEDTDNDSDNGVTAHGVRPDGATTDDDAGANQGNGDDSAGERKEDPSRAGAEQTAGKT